MADDRLIVALDVSTMDAMKSIVSSLGDSVSFYKVGMELFYAEGDQTVRYLQEHGKHVFLDLKLHDIPNTVAHGVSSLTRLGANLITIHGQGGPIMMKAAAEAARESAEKLGIERPKLLAITVLTSFDDESWTSIGGQLPIADQVIRLAKLAKESGMDGVVCSALDSRSLRARFPYRYTRYSPILCSYKRPKAHCYTIERITGWCISPCYWPTYYAG